MNKIKGRNMLVFVDGLAVAGNVECSLSMESEVVEVTPTSQALWREYITKCKTWKCSSSHLMILDSDDNNGNIAHFMDLLGTSVTLTFGSIAEDPNERTPKDIVKNGMLSYTGTAIVTGISISAKNGSHVSGSFEFQGTGALTAAQADYFVDGDSIYAKSDVVEVDDDTATMSEASVSGTTVNV